MNAKFKQAIHDAGLRAPDFLIPGTFQRFPGRGKSAKNRAGWALLFDDLKGGVFGDFSSDFQQCWYEGIEDFTPEQRKAFAKRCEEARKTAAAERDKEYRAAAEVAKQILSDANSDPAQHPYAIKKTVDFGPLVKRGAWPQREWTDAMLVPLFAADGALATVQAINADGEKDFLRGGKKAGNFHTLGEIAGENRIFVGEGLATTAAVNTVTGKPAVAAMDAGNLQIVALAIRKLAPDAEIILLADNDIKADGTNTGVEAATRAAEAVGGRVAIPELDGKKCDFWDVLNERGADAVRDQLGAGATSTLFDDGDTLGANAKPAQFLINRILEADAHGILGAQSQAFKSFLAIKLAHSICTGRDFFGHEVFTTGPVLYVCGEGRGAVQRRIKATQIQLGDFGGNLKIWNGDIAIDSPQSMRALKGAIEQLKPVLVVFDTFSSLIGGDINENDNAQVARVLRLVKDTCAGASSLVVHHFGKTESSGFRGASAFFSNIDFGFVMKREADSMTTELSCSKMKDGEPFAPITMVAEVVELGFDNQDGLPATSLVLQMANHAIAKGRARRQPKPKVAAILTALIEATDKHGISPPPEIRAKYSGLNGRQITTRKAWRDQAFKVLSVDSEGDDKSKYNAKRKAFDRAADTLFNDGFIVMHGDYAWKAL